MLSGNVVEGDEAYEFTWVGKKAAIVEADKPIRKTLRPCPEESVDWDATENLYIEGDNLEVLKLLQESYLGKVKMVYIGPPYVYLEQTAWNNYNESTDLRACVAEYYRRFECLPSAILADKIYQTRANRAFCNQYGIRLSGPALGRKTEEKSQQEKEQMYQDSCERNIIEGRNGLAKRRYGLDLIMSKLEENAKTEAAFSILVMNAFRKIREVFMRFFPTLDYFVFYGRCFPLCPAG